MLSVIIPAYNEELSIDKAYYTISEILNNAVIDNEIIFIDDGSTDNSEKICEHYSELNKKIKVYSVKRFNTRRTVRYI